MNAQVTHTPGPWLLGYSNHHHSHDIYAGKAAGFKHIAFVNTGHADDADKSEADARLIVAAPDHALIAAALCAGARWESATREFCIDGLRHATTLDQFGVPKMTSGMRDACAKVLAARS